MVEHVHSRVQRSIEPNSDVQYGSVSTFPCKHWPLTCCWAWQLLRRGVVAPEGAGAVGAPEGAGAAAGPSKHVPSPPGRPLVSDRSRALASLSFFCLWVKNLVYRVNEYKYRCFSSPDL